MEYLEPYRLTILILGLSGLLSLLQLLIADAVGIKLKHPPGLPVTADHDNFHFRAMRAHLNMNESIAVFVLFALFALFSAASAQWLGIFACVYFAGRLVHMLCYYLSLNLMRSAAFAVSVVGLLGMFVQGLRAWL